MSVAAVMDAWSQTHLLVVGDVMLDKYVVGAVERISPEAPVPIVKVLSRSDRPGGAANVAMNASCLGARITLAGVRGDDADGSQLERQLAEAGIVSLFAVAHDRPTISKTRVLGGRQQMLRLDVEPSALLSQEVSQPLLADILDHLDAGISAVVLSDYAKGMLTETVCRAVIDRAREFRIPIIVDPKGRDYSRYRGATMLCPNLAELALATGVAAQDFDAVLAAGEALLGPLELGSIAVTLSERGILALDGRTRTHMPARARQVFDVSGAGDTVTAVLALCAASGIAPMAALRLANLAAGIVVGKVGTSPIYRHELIAALSGKGTEAAGKIYSRRQMTLRVEDWRAAGERIVFTNGCFDLLHAGHLKLLEEARRCGDRLVVGLNSDASVRLLKGPSRPVNGEQQRSRMLAAMHAVDAVVLFSEPTPLRTVLALRPDVLVKGSDYREDQIVGAAEVLSWRGEVVRVPVVDGLSTTELIGQASLQMA